MSGDARGTVRQPSRRELPERPWRARRNGRPSAASAAGPAAQEAVRRALMVMTVVVGVTFPLFRPPETSDLVTAVASALALGVAFGLWRRLAHPLTLLRVATVGAVFLMTWGIVVALDAMELGTPLGVRFLAYAGILMTLALFVLGTRVGFILTVAVLGVWLLVVAQDEDGAMLLAVPDGEVFIAARYAFVLLLLLWGVLRANDVLQAERDALRAQTLVDRADRRERLEREQRRTRLLAEAAHELRAPLATIEAGTQTLGTHGDVLDEDMKEKVLDAISHAAGRLDRRTLELLDAAHDRVTTIPANRVAVDAAAVVAASLDDLGPLTDGHDVQRHLEAPLPADLDPDGLDHILTNLVHNAVKYAPRGTTIEVTLWRDDHETVLVVADHGPGVPEGIRDELFTPWTRDESHEDIDGSGVGLAVARTWARRHGGDIVLLDTTVGAAFEVRLPDVD